VDAISVVIIDIRSEQPLQMHLVDSNHMVQQFAAAASHPALGNTVLPRTTNGGPHSLDIHGANCRGNFGAVLGVVIQDEKLGCWFVGKGFAQLLHAIQVLVGWRVTRHSYTTLLRQNNNNPKVVQGLLRHASYSITMNVYDEAMSEEKRNAHRGVIQQLNRSVTRSAPKPAIPQVVDFVGVPDGI
jgi:hypothetical protein